MTENPGPPPQAEPPAEPLTERPSAEPPTVPTAAIRPAAMPVTQPPPAEPPTVIASIPELPATPATPAPQAPPAPPSRAAPAEPEASLTCPSCGATVWPGDNFCEVCRAELAPALVSGAEPERAARCPDCQDAGVTAEGYCESCGRKVPDGSDHSELELGLLAGITDRGLRHHRNEDAMALATTQAPGGDPVALVVVCDGVSTSSRPDEASHRAAKTAMEVLLSGIRMSADPELASADAFAAAREALIALAAEDPAATNAPSATFVSAVITTQDITICWLGDSRAYWLHASGDAQTRQLSTDDSVAQELIARGLLSEPEALASPAGHVITGWVGADLRDAEPHVVTFAPGGDGVVLLCSDGLWNYQPAATELAKMALPAALTDPLGSAAKLVKFALDSGGGDNITVVLVPFPPGERRSAQAPAGQVSATSDTVHSVTMHRAAVAQGAVISAAFPRTDAAEVPQIEENPQT
jgi:serine/threonine protein phosphatase PrpC